MNREIKYRFWYVHDNKMYGVLSVSARFPDEDFNRVFIARELSHGEPLNYRADGKSGILMQYVGMIDRNGKDIYEGDILKGERIERKRGDIPRHKADMIFEVKWDKRKCAFVIYYHKMNWDSIIGFLQDAPYEIIGNIYENPDLLK